MNLTIGQYYPTKSIVHDLDSRTKILATVLYIVAIFVAKGIVSYGICTLFLGCAIFKSNVPFKMLLRGLKSIIIIIIFTVVLNMLFIRTGDLVFRLGFLKIYSGGLYTAILLCVRLILLVVGSSLLTLTTSPIKLTEGIERLLKPFKKVGLPAHEIAMMMTIALRFIPTLVEELNKIKMAQTARGADFDNGNLMHKAKAMIPLLVPLFISSFRRADELAMAMEARCYRGDVNRTKMHPLVYTKKDYVTMAILVALVVVVLLIRIIWGV